MARDMDKSEIVERLMDRALRDVDGALAGSIDPGRASLVGHARQIISTLREAVDAKTSLGGNLARLYEYMEVQLDKGVTEDEPLKEVKDLLGEIHSAWLAAIVRPPGSAPPG
jgi:flagellin-specific chaperone FliS